MLATVIAISFAMLSLSILLTLWRLFRGPDLPDRIMALDTLYIIAVAFLVLLGIHLDTSIYFEAALLIALLGFVGTIAFCKYVLRGDIIE
jgi:multicomponent K+:H+ antiporter subunit F